MKKKTHTLYWNKWVWKITVLRKRQPMIEYWTWLEGPIHSGPVWEMRRTELTFSWRCNQQTSVWRWSNSMTFADFSGYFLWGRTYTHFEGSRGHRDTISDFQLRVKLKIGCVLTAVKLLAVVKLFLPASSLFFVILSSYICIQIQCLKNDVKLW